MDKLSEMADYLDRLADNIRDPELGPPVLAPYNLNMIARELRKLAIEKGYLIAPPM